jgi:hypothetical protein
MNTLNTEYPKKELSNEELAKVAAAQYEQSNVDTPIKSNYQFPTEIIELPSQGHFYPVDSPLATGKVEMKYMTAKEEDILTTQSYIKQGVVIDKLLQSLVVSNSQGKRININELLIGDKNALVIAARVLGYGKEYEIEITTPSGNKQKETVDLTQFEAKQIDFNLTAKGTNRFPFELPASKRIVEIKLLTQKDTDAIEQEVKALKKNKIGSSTDALLSTTLIHTIVAVDGDSSQSTIREFVNNMLAIDSRALRGFINMIKPDIDLTCHFTDNETDESFTATLPLSVNFFWPGA